MILTFFIGDLNTTSDLAVVETHLEVETYILYFIHIFYFIFYFCFLFCFILCFFVCFFQFIPYFPFLGDRRCYFTVR